MNKNGVIITLAVFMLGMALIGLTQSIKANSRIAEDNKKYESIIDRVSTKHENIENNIMDIIWNTSGLVYNATDTSITFTESLPNTKVGATEISILRYKEFVEQHKDALDINIASGTVDLSTITILPYNINYSHEDANATHGNKFNNSIYYLPESINDFNAYIVDITLQNQPYSGISITDASCCNYQQPGQQGKWCTNPSTPPAENYCPEQSGGLHKPGKWLTIIVRNSTKIPLDQNFFCGIWGDYNNFTCVFKIATSGNQKKDVVMTLSPGGKINIENDNSVPIDITTGIDFGKYAPYPPYIGLPKGFVAVGDGKLSAEKR